MTDLYSFTSRTKSWGESTEIRYDGAAAGDLLASCASEAFKALGQDEHLLMIAASEHSVIPDDATFDEERDQWFSFVWKIEAPLKIYSDYVTDVDGTTKKASFESTLWHLKLPEFEPVNSIVLAPVAQKSSLNWKEEALEWLTRYGVNNQGNVYLENPPSKMFDDLRFRSNAEINLYKALLEKTDIPFMALPVVMRQDLPKRPDGKTRRIEPDFVLICPGYTIFIEIDGPSHKETPAEADQRLVFLRERGIIVRRLGVEGCKDADTARATLVEMLQSASREAGSR